MHERDVRMRVHVVLENAHGERIAEVKTDQVFREMFGELTLGTALSSLGRCFEMQVLSPARGLIRAYIASLEEKVPHRRRDGGSEVPEHWPGDTEVIREMDRRAMEMLGTAGK